MHKASRLCFVTSILLVQVQRYRDTVHLLKECTKAKVYRYTLTLILLLYLALNHCTRSDSDNTILNYTHTSYRPKVYCARPRSRILAPDLKVTRCRSFPLVSHISSVQSLAPSLLDTSKLVITNPRMSKAHSNSSFLSKERDKSSVYLYVISLWQGARNRPLFLCNKFLR